MITEKILLGKFLNNEFRAIVYRVNGNEKFRFVIDFTKETFMEVLYYLETMFSFQKEEMECV